MYPFLDLKAGEPNPTLEIACADFAPPLSVVRGHKPLRDFTIIKDNRKLLIIYCFLFYFSVSSIFVIICLKKYNPFRLV